MHVGIVSDFKKFMLIYVTLGKQRKAVVENKNNL